MTTSWDVKSISTSTPSSAPATVANTGAPPMSCRRRSAATPGAQLEVVGGQHAGDERRAGPAGRAGDADRRHRRRNTPPDRSHSTPSSSEKPLTGGAAAGGGRRAPGQGRAATAGVDLAPPARRARRRLVGRRRRAAAVGGLRPSSRPPARRASRCCRQAEKSRSSRLEMSLIIPPRPNEASRPVIVKSVTASTRVPPQSVGVQRVDDRRARAALAALVAALAPRASRCASPRPPTRS